MTCEHICRVRSKVRSTEMRKKIVLKSILNM